MRAPEQRQQDALYSGRVDNDRRGNVRVACCLPGFAVFYAGPHGPRPKTLAVVAIVPAILVTVLDVAIVAYRRYSQPISEK